jgi:hypothetical protein
MNEYIFEIEYDDGYIAEYATCAVNKIMAYDMVIEYLKDCGVDPATVKVGIISVHVFDEEENDA